jgi:hypothetical protein
VSILSCCQDAAVELNQVKPTSVFSSTDQFAAELLLQAKETADSLLNEEHDWRSLTKLCTLQGNASTIQFPLATGAPDFVRMVKNGKLHSLRFRNATFRKARDLDEWLYLNDSLLVGSPGNWIMLGGAMQIFPPMPANDTARFYYISNLIVTGAGATPQTGFVADADTFVLPERLLRLGIIWRWRAAKRMEYSEDLQNYEIAKQAAMGADKGSQIIAVGRQRVNANSDFAYPALLG